jgi:TrpR-related protein YerC/YecD
MNTQKRIENLCAGIAKLKDSAAVARFLEDLCTPSELTALADRWHVALLLEQEIPYRKINELSGVSTATITRVARCLEYGSGGYRQLLPKRAKGK